jgi:hypothetical protein
MTGRPVAALTESVARQIVREHNGNRDRIAVALAEEVIARGGWKANTCKPLLRAFELAAPSLPGEAETPSRVVMLTPTGDRVVVLRGPDEDGLCGVEHLDRSGTSIQAFSSLRVAPS